MRMRMRVNTVQYIDIHAEQLCWAPGNRARVAGTQQTHGARGTIMVPSSGTGGDCMVEALPVAVAVL